MTEEIVTFLSILRNQKKPSGLTIDNKELWCRCPYCGDSLKSLHKGHFYINTKPPFMFYCQRCSESGILTNDVLRDLSIFDTTAFILLAEINKNYEDSEEYIPPVRKKLIINNEETKALEYINKRFDVEFDIKELTEKYRCILNPKKFLRDNNLEENKLFNYENAIGFVSEDDSHITFRSIDNNSKIRYFVHTINMYGTKTYIIKNQVDVLKPTINVHVTEGCFDIIGIDKFIVDSSNMQDIFVAACGKSFMRAIKTITQKGFLNLNINFYSDQDVKIDVFSYLRKNNVELYSNNVKVYYNTLEKDYGVPANRIKLREGVIYG